MANLEFSKKESLLLIYEAIVPIVSRYVSIHLERNNEGRLRAYSRQDASQAWIMVKNDIYPADCVVSLDLLVPNQQLKVESFGDKPTISTFETHGGSEGSASVDIESLRTAIAEQARINAEQQEQIDKNTEINTEQSKSIEKQAEAIQDSTTLADEEEISNLFK